MTAYHVNAGSVSSILLQVRRLLTNRTPEVSAVCEQLQVVYTKQMHMMTHDYCA
jgi:hypothetical protein